MTMYVEDLITQIANSSKAYKIEAADFEFVASLAYQIQTGKALTSRQAFAIMKTLVKYTHDAELLFGISTLDYSNCLREKSFRKELRVTVQKRTEARYLGDNLVGFSYHYKKDISQDATDLKSLWREGFQIVSVNHKNIEKLISFLGKYSFEVDEVLEEYLALCLSSKNQESHFVMDGNTVVCNICDSEVISNFLLHVVGAELI